MEENNKNWHDKYYKVLLIIPALILLVSLLQITIFYKQNGDFFRKDISLTGGTSVTLYDGELSIPQLLEDLSPQLEDLNARAISDLVTGEQKAIILQTKNDGDSTKVALENYLGYELNSENSSFEFTGSSLSDSFYKQLISAIIVAFFFMGIVVFIIFRNFVPSFAVIISAFADIVMTVAFVNLLGMKMSTAGIVAFLMLIGYSVDTDILLTTRVLKRHEGNLNHRLLESLKTGMTMTLTSLFAIVVALFIVRPFSGVLTQIFTILVIGLAFDLINTWITNVSILKWYVEERKK